MQLSLEPNSISSFFTPCLSLVRFGKLRSVSQETGQHLVTSPVSLREARWSYEREGVGKGKWGWPRMESLGTAAEQTGSGLAWE